MKRVDFFLSICIGLFGLIMAVWVIPGQSAPGGRYGLPPSAVPTVCCIGLVILAAVLLFKSLPGSWSREGGSGVRIPWIHICVVSGIAFAGAGIMTFAGFIPAGIFVVTASMTAMGARSFWLIGSCSILVPVIVYSLLWHGLRMPLP